MQIIDHQSTKIVATVGPACSSYDNLLKLAQVGVNVFRLNFSHGTHEDHLKVINRVTYINEKYNLHIITNGFSQVQFTKLKKSKLAPFFATVTSSEEVGVKKPNPLVFTTALLKAGATAQSSVMIGDTFDADILGAEGVGMDTIFFNYRKEIPKNGYKVVDYLLEIKDLL